MDYLGEAKDFLKNYKYYKIASKNLQNKLNELVSKLEGYKSVVYSDMPSGKSGAAPDDRLCNMIFEKDRISELLKENKSKISEIETILSNLSDDHRNILIKAYINEESEVQITMDLCISRRTYYRYKNDAIRELARQLFGIKTDGY